jgi:hypothetical protein
MAMASPVNFLVPDASVKVFPKSSTSIRVAMTACPARRPHHIPTKKKATYPIKYLHLKSHTGKVILRA